MSAKGISDHDQLFYKDGYLLGKKAAQEIKNEAAFLSHIESMYSAVDDLINSLLAVARKQNVGIDCKKGCSWCCHQAVFANSYEIHYLGNYLKKNFSRQEQNELIKKASDKNKITSTLSQEKVLNYKSPCPLLKDGACTAYNARPMACRIYLSLKVSTCTEFYHRPENPDNFPALLDFPLQAGRMMNEGFIAALKESEVLVSEFRLEEGLETILTTGSNL